MIYTIPLKKDVKNGEIHGELTDGVEATDENKRRASSSLQYEEQHLPPYLPQAQHLLTMSARVVQMVMVRERM